MKAQKLQSLVSLLLETQFKKKHLVALSTAEIAGGSINISYRADHRAHSRTFNLKNGLIEQFITHELSTINDEIDEIKNKIKVLVQEGGE